MFLRRYNPRMAITLLRGVVSFSGWVNESVGRVLSWLLPAMTATVLTIIVCGSIFRVGWVWLGESVTYMHAALFMLAAAYALRCDAHARIDIFYRRMSPRGRAMVNLFGALFLLLPTCVVILIYAVPYAADSWKNLEHSSEGGGLPLVFLLKTCIPLSAALLALEGLAMAARSVLELAERK